MTWTVLWGSEECGRGNALDGNWIRVTGKEGDGVFATK